LNVIDEGLLDLTLSTRIGCAEEVEEVRVLKNLTGHIGIGGRESRREVGDGFALAFVSTIFDLENKDIVGPAVLESLTGVPEPVIVLGQFL
jgi:hypothetical protein